MAGGFFDAARGAVDALRRELLKERIREEIITSTTERRNSETKVRCEHVVPHHGLSPARQADRRRPHILLSPELRLGEAMGAPGVVMSRRPVKDRLSGWHRSQSQWHDRSAGNEESSSVCWVRHLTCSILFCATIPSVFISNVLKKSGNAAMLKISFQLGIHLLHCYKICPPLKSDMLSLTESQLFLPNITVFLVVSTSHVSLCNKL